MQKRVRNYIREYQMFEGGGHVVAAVSGGADSVCLLHLLTALKEELNITIYAVHVHHGLRGEEADRDAAYVKELSKNLEVPCLVVQKDVFAYSEEHGLTVEEAGRVLRYQIFQEEAERLGGAKIAVAHHSLDQAETILHHLFRGSSLKGLGGMMPVRENIVRPLLTCSRAEILRYLKNHKLSYCEDSTNALQNYTRNKLRHTVIPMIVSEVNDGAVEHVLHAGWMAGQADRYLSDVAKRILKEHGIRLGHEPESMHGIGIDALVLSGQDPIIRTYMILEMMHQICGSRKDMTARHVTGVESLLGKEVGARVDLPYALTARKTYDKLWIEDKNYGISVDKKEAAQLPQPEFTVFSYEKHQEIPQNEYTKWFDYDKINGALSVRIRQTGDYITLKDGSRKTVKAFMIDEKIPREQRDSIPLLAEENHVLWIVGYRISEYYKVVDKTQQILQAKIDGGRYCGR